MSALGAIQDKNAHLETSLSAETRLKLDLFSALGEAKRQIEIQQGEPHSLKKIYMKRCTMLWLIYNQVNALSLNKIVYGKVSCALIEYH